MNKPTKKELTDRTLKAEQAVENIKKLVCLHLEKCVLKDELTELAIGDNSEVNEANERIL